MFRVVVPPAPWEPSNGKMVHDEIALAECLHRRQAIAHPVCPVAVRVEIEHAVVADIDLVVFNRLGGDDLHLRPILAVEDRFGGGKVGRRNDTAMVIQVERGVDDAGGIGIMAQPQNDLIDPWRAD